METRHASPRLPLLPKMGGNSRLGLSNLLIIKISGNIFKRVQGLPRSSHLWGRYPEICIFQKLSGPSDTQPGRKPLHCTGLRSHLAVWKATRECDTPGRVTLNVIPLCPSPQGCARPSGRRVSAAPSAGHAVKPALRPAPSMGKPGGVPQRPRRM